MELTDAQIEAANERGRIAYATEPRAVSARYDAKAGRIVVELASGATFAFPPALAQGLCDASPEELAEIEVSPAGFGLHWPRIDEILVAKQRLELAIVHFRNDDPVIRP